MLLKVTDNIKHFNNTPEINNEISPKKNPKLEKASRQFESLLTSMLIKTMMQSTKGMFGDNSYGGDFYSTIFESQLADKISMGKGLGIADKIYNKLNEELNPAQKNNIKLKPLEKLNINKNKTLKIAPSNSALDRISEYDNIISDAADQFGIDKNLIKSVILTESGGHKNAVSKANAKGLMQLMDSTAVDMGVKNVLDPKENIYGGTKYLAQNASTI